MMFLNGCTGWKDELSGVPAPSAAGNLSAIGLRHRAALLAALNPSSISSVSAESEAGGVSGTPRMGPRLHQGCVLQ